MVIAENDSYLVDGKKAHSIWNNGKDTAIIIDISTKEDYVYTQMAIFFADWMSE